MSLPLSPPKEISTQNNVPFIKVLGTRVDAVSFDSASSLAESFLTNETPRWIVTANALMLLESAKDLKLQSTLEKASLVLTDSIGVCWAARFLKKPPLARIPGIDLAYHLCEMASKKKLKVFLFGGKPGIALKAAKFLTEKFPEISIVGTKDGFFKPESNANIVHDIAAQQPHLILVALGMPRQEIWISEHLNCFSAGLFIGVGGTFDVWGGEVMRAPRWFQEKGLEWLYRVWKEPFRWPRIAQLPVFVWKILLEKLGFN